MKNFIALVVLLCAVMISSTASASVIENYFLATDNYISYNLDNFFIEFEREEVEKLIAERVENSRTESQDQRYVAKYDGWLELAGIKPRDESEDPRLSIDAPEEDPRLTTDFAKLREKPKDDKSSALDNLREFALTGTIIIIVAIISIFFAYKYRENRQFIAENSIKTWLLTFVDEKNFWAFIFFVVSFVSCILYVPYNMIAPSNPNIIHKTAYSTLFEIPKDFKPKITTIDYQKLAFREILILFGCCAGYTASIIIKKKI